MFGKRSDEPRTAQDRARAAAERAARRAGRPLPPEAFEDAVRPPDVEPRDAIEPPVAARDDDAPPAAAPPREDAAPRDDDAPPAATPRDIAAPRPDAAPPAAAPPAAAPRDDDAPPAAAPRDAAAPPAAAPPAAAPRHADAPRDAIEPLDNAPPAAAPRYDDDAPPSAAPRYGDDPPPAAAPRYGDDAPPAAAPRHDDDAPPAAAPRHDDHAPRAASPPSGAPDATPRDAPRRASAPGDDDAAPRDGAPPARTPGENAPARRGAEFHDPQPTIEYTPFQTDEHQVARDESRDEAPLGRPRDDEPRLVAARGHARHDEDDVHAYATARGDTAEHAIDDGTGEAGALETGEHQAYEETEARPPVPLRRAPARAASTPRKRPAPAAPRRGASAPKRTRATGEGHWGRRLAAVVALIVLAGALYTFNATFQPFHGDGSGDVAVDVPDGADAGKIGELLVAKGVIDSARFFELNATISGDRGNLRPGSYTLQKGMTNGAVIDVLTKVPDAPKAAETVSVTLVEGPSRKENAPVVDKSKKVEGSYASASASKATLARIRKLGAPKGTKTTEGFLFPATYELEAGSTANELVKQQLDAFEENFAKVDMRYAKRKNLSRYDVLTIASMIEREAQLPKERPLVSAVIYNRLKEGMPLGIDATIRYSTNNWKRPIRQSELDAQEPYNTRINRDLPPTPIGNPGLASIKAAAKPSSKGYLFYVRKPGDSGEHAFSSTDAQFQRDVAKYQSSRDGK